MKRIIVSLIIFTFLLSTISVMAAEGDGLTIVEMGGKYGYVDKTGKEIISAKYDIAYPFEGGLAIVAKDIDFFDFRYGIINKNGEEIIPFKYRYIYPIREGIFGVQGENEKYGYIDKTGKEITAIKYDLIWAFRDGLGKVRLNSKYGYVDKTGKEIIPLKYDYIPSTDNPETTDYDYNNTTPFNEGLAAVGIGTIDEWGIFNGKYGYIDKTGKEIIPPKYDYASPFSNGVAKVMLNDKWDTIENPLKGKQDIKLKATPTPSKVLVNGKEVSFDAYLIEGNNYFKLRDLASVLNGTEKEFEVIWDENKKAINLISNKGYTAVGGEMAEGDGKTKTPILNTSIIYKDGIELKLTAYTISGNNYFKLRDIGKAFDFGVNWDDKTKTITIDTAYSYVEN